MNKGSADDLIARFGSGGHDDPRKAVGRFIVFFGVADGSHCTMEMLAEARKQQIAGRNVVVAGLSGSLVAGDKEVIQLLTTDFGKQTCTAAPDIASILSLKPQLAVIGNLADANPPGSANARRYDDAVALVEAGIDVYGTLFAQNLARGADLIRRLSGVSVRDVVPDGIIADAELRLSDDAPGMLLQKVRGNELDEIGSAVYSENVLMALRELAWRTAAEWVAREADRFMSGRQIAAQWRSGERFLAVVSPGTDSESAVRRAASIAAEAGAPWVAVYVETPRVLDKAAQATITGTLGLAAELGGEVITTTSADEARGLLRVAEERNSSRIIIGNATRSSRWFPEIGGIFQRLVRETPGIDIQVAASALRAARKPAREWPIPRGKAWPQYLMAAGVIGAIAAGILKWGPLGGGPHAGAIIFLLAVVVLGSFIRRGPILLTATMSALLWNYLLVPPLFTFSITKMEDAALFSTFFIVALIMGKLSTRIREQQEAGKLREQHSTALYLLTRALNEATTLQEIARSALQHVEPAFRCDVVLLLSGWPDAPEAFSLTGSVPILTRDERRAATWAYLHRERAGRFTNNLQEAGRLYVPLKSGENILGLMGLRLEQESPPTIHQQNLLNSFAQQIAFALERHRLREASQQARLLAESERLSKTLLNSVSHEIRTPLAVIKSAVGNLTQMNERQKSAAHDETMTALQDATERLNRLIGNVLDITRLESGHVKPRLNQCDVADLIHLAVSATEKDLSRHHVEIRIAPNLPIVSMDFVLMEQALTNLLANAAGHTPAGTPVSVSARADGEFLVIEVADRGPGIRPEHLGRIFDKFYRCPEAGPGGSGLGLSLVKGFVEAQGGRVKVENRPGGGAIFAICVPLGNIAAVSVEACA